MMPPPSACPPKEITTDIQTNKITAPGTNGGSYLVQLPPNYHHLRAHPVVLVLHSGREDAETTIKRFSHEAAKHGFIVAAPNWPGRAGLRVNFLGTKKERDSVLDTLRDLRRRYQVDSDRVFMFGWEDGANLAFDVGLSNPDQFAGVVPMNGTLTAFGKRYYSTNAQYLPFYVIEGEKNGANPKIMQDLFKKEWTHEPYTGIYVEYNGRASEWFSAEVPLVMNWMSKKKRSMPMREMGRASTGTGLGEEFRSSRPSETRFYWLSADGIAQQCLGEHSLPLNRYPANYRPATFQGSIFVGNKSKKDGKGEIWNHVSINATGLKNKKVTFWITPEMNLNMDLPFQFYLNGQQAGPRRQIAPSLDTLMEELYLSGDRHRLYIAKVDINS
jgi:dienelactone hydrolase